MNGATKKTKGWARSLSPILLTKHSPNLSYWAKKSVQKTKKYLNKRDVLEMTCWTREVCMRGILPIEFHNKEQKCRFLA